MTRQAYFPGETISNLTFTATNGGALFDPASVALTWKQGKNGADQTATVSNPSTGIYTANIAIPNSNGNIHWRWKTTEPVMVEEGTVRVKHGKFTASSRDYA